ncbi:Myosin-binding protein 1 [Striga hermonthica]|uniref:Myosin-binding protein 1 n=1 Tax=Striga hermonthica TaxID=68872 RepID=A0A9N7NDW5_STRHE|nr:Myosin-binding protein 1 [Striga hermonthica]
MDVRRVQATEAGPKITVTIVSALVWAVFEWMLMFLIILNAGFWQLVTRFARYCQLQIPCLLCSSESFNLYRDLICQSHKLKISSLFLCRTHNNLVDVHETCESCILNKSNSETYRFVVGEMGAVPHDGLVESGLRKCICCNEQWVSRTWACELSQSISISPQGPDAQFPHLGYTKVKGTSDSGSESRFSDTQSADTLIREVEILGPDLETKYLSTEPQVLSMADDAPAPPQVKTSFYKSVDPTDSRHTVEPKAALEHGSGEMKWKQGDHNNDICKPYETISFSEVLPSPDIDGTQYDESKGPDPTNASRPETNKPQSLDLGDAYRLAVTGTRGRQLSGKFLEQQKSMAESTRASEDLKLLLSQLSAANSEDQTIQRRISLERNESGLSLDGTTLSEIEGESSVDRLKRQVEHDRRIISGLYRELEEERSASAVAASQAMAMITRLQEEKAALHMEALQYLRMMEEQAEYDGEALQKANILLAEKEKLVRELASQLGPSEAQQADLSTSD